MKQDYMTNGLYPRALAAVILLLASNATHAQSERSGFTTWAEPNCGQWLRSPDDQSKIWLLGALAGHAFGHHLRSGGQSNALASLHSPDQAFVWMDKWCSENPLSRFSVGVHVLFGELASTPSAQP